MKLSVAWTGISTFAKNYFYFLLREAGQDPSLGLVGTPFREVKQVKL